jgi:hypothetical protein
MTSLYFCTKPASHERETRRDGTLVLTQFGGQELYRDRGSALHFLQQGMKAIRLRNKSKTQAYHSCRQLQYSLQYRGHTNRPLDVQ